VASRRPRYFYIAEPPYPRERIGGERRHQLEAELVLDPWARYQTAKGRAKQAYRRKHPVAYEVRTRGRKVAQKYQRQAERQVVRGAERVAERVVNVSIESAAKATEAVAGLATKYGGKLKAAAVAAIPALQVGGIAIAAGLASYILTRAAIEGSRKNREERQRIANQAYRDARRQLKEKLGLASERDLPPELMRPLTAAWKEALVKARAPFEPTSRGRIY